MSASDFHALIESSKKTPDGLTVFLDGDDYIMAGDCMLEEPAIFSSREKTALYISGILKISSTVTFQNVEFILENNAANAPELFIEAGGMAEFQSCRFTYAAPHQEEGVPQTVKVMASNGGSLSAKSCSFLNVTLHASDNADLTLSECDLSGSAESTPLVVAQDGGKVELIDTKLHDGLGYAVWVSSGGQASLSTCTIWGMTQDCAIMCEDSGSRLEAHECTIRDGIQPAVVVNEGIMSLSGCDLSGSAESHSLVVAEDGGKVELTDTKLHDGLSNAVWVSSGGQAGLSTCTIWGMTQDSAILCEDSGSRLETHECTIRDGMQPAFVVNEGVMSLSGCDLSGSAENISLVVARDGGKVELIDTKLHDGLSRAVRISSGGRASLSACTIWGMTQNSAIQCEDSGSRLEAHECIIRDGKQPAFVVNEGVMSLSGCDLSGSVEILALVIARDGSKVELTDTKLHDGLSSAVLVRSGSQVCLSTCTIWGMTQDSAIACVDSGSRLEAHECTIRDGKQPACVWIEGVMSLSGCDLSGSAENTPLVMALEGGKVELIDTKLHDGLGYAVRIRSGGYASVQQCTIWACEGDPPISCSSDGGVRESGNTIRLGMPAIPAVKTLRSMTGLHKVKSEIRDFINLAQTISERKKRGLLTPPISLHLVFTGNPGTGKTTVARLIGEIYKSLGFLSSGHVVEVDRSKLVHNWIGRTAIQTNEVIDSALDGVLFIDEAYALIGTTEQDYGQEAINALLARMENDRDRLAVIVAGYTTPMENFISSNPGLKSRFTRTLEFDDYTVPELEKIFQNMVREQEYTQDSGFKQAVHSRIQEVYDTRSADFGNARDMRTLFERIITRQASRISKSGNMEDLQTLRAEDVPPLPVKEEKTENKKPAPSYGVLDRMELDRAMQELNGMIGLDSVKHEIRRLVSLVQTVQRRKLANPTIELTLPSRHLVFLGNPGTGKTTVARLIGKIYKAIGLLAQGQIVEVDRSKLIAPYIGQTAPKVMEAVNRAEGGILFIDEAYALSQGGENDFGQEAIDTLLKQMEDRRDHLAIIVAGYEVPMGEFMASNPGLKSRFTRYITFDDYNPEQLGAIFMQLIRKEGFYLDEESSAALKNGMSALYENRGADFGNGRTVRNLYEATREAQAYRVSQDEQADLNLISSKDLEEAFGVTITPCA